MSERNLLLRIASALVLIPVVFALVLWREPLGFASLVLLAAAIGLGEFAQLTLPDQRPRARVVLVVLGLAFAVAVYLRPQLGFVFVLAVIVLLALDVLLSSGSDLQVAVRRLGMSVFGVFYVGGLITTLPLLHRDVPDGPWWVITAFVVTFGNDTGAYAAGRTMGRHKLAPLISPGKTIEGAIGGLLAGIGVLLAYRALFFSGLQVFDAVVIGLVAGVLGPTGDLMESMLKRAAGAKDSGRLIPGHGGMLDRIDALLFISAYVFVHTQLFR
jgi:phosphatidate cytidylyltransferase